MMTRFDEDDPADGLMERRWFAIDREAGKLQSECDTLAAVFAMAEDAWRDACARLAELEAIRDSLGREIARRSAAVERGDDAAPGDPDTRPKGDESHVAQFMESVASMT
jgi:hypothetical protein